MSHRSIKFKKSDRYRFHHAGIISLVIVVIMVSCIMAREVSRVGTTAAPFLKIPVGARALSMGEAHVTQVNDASALYWNPGVLGNLNQTQLLLNHYDYIMDISYEFAGVVLPLQSFGTVGLFFSYLGMGEIERTTVREPEGTGEKAAASSFTTGLSYGRALTERFTIGGTIKYIREQIWHSHASGVAVDLGLLYTTIFKNMKVGMSISNFGTSMQMQGRDLLVQHDIDPTNGGNNSSLNADIKTDAFSLPIFFRVGISSNFARDFFEISGHDFIVEINAIHPNDNYEYMNIGAEYVWKDFIALRSGYRQLFLVDSEGGLTFGAGLRVDVQGYQIQFDYAAADFGRFDYLNKFSLLLLF
jgi:hypothetical protein